MVLFRKVRWKNFLNTGDEFIEIDLRAHPTTLIMGNNGTGKSTVLDALIFGLFGVAFRNVNIPNLVNDTNEEDMVVEVEFSVGRTNYRVRRGVGPRLFEIYINNVLLDQESKSRDYQKYLEQTILKLNRKSFTQVVVLGSASFVPFMRLKKAERRYLIEDLLDIQIFSAMNIVLKDKVSDMKDEYISYANQIELQNEKITLVKSYLKKLQSDSINATSDKKQLIGENQLQKRIDEDAISVVQEDIDNLLKSILDSAKVQEHIRKLEMVEDKLKTNKHKTEREKDFYKDNNECPTCKQSIDENFKTNIVAEKTKLIQDIVDTLVKLETELTVYETRSQEIAAIISNIEEKNKEINEHQISIRAIDTFIEKIQEEIEELQEKSGDTKQQEKKLKELNCDLVKVTEQRDELTSRKHYLDIISVMLKDTGIKTRIIKQYLPVINKTVNKYLASMDFFANFNLDENFNEVIHIRGSKERTYYQLSEGQKLRIDLAVLFTWRDIAKMKNNANCNLLLMDEIFEKSLDASGVEDLLKILQNLSKDINIFIISPQGDLLVDKFSNSLRFTEEQGFSVLEK